MVAIEVQLILSVHGQKGWEGQWSWHLIIAKGREGNQYYRFTTIRLVRRLGQPIRDKPRKAVGNCSTKEFYHNSADRALSLVVVCNKSLHQKTPRVKSSHEELEVVARILGFRGESIHTSTRGHSGPVTPTTTLNSLCAVDCTKCPGYSRQAVRTRDYLDLQCFRWLRPRESIFKEFVQK